MVKGLRVRDLPSLAGKVTASFAAGTRMTVVGNPTSLGPVSAEGFDWYLVQYRADENDPATEVLGFAAAGDPATPFLATLRPRCEAAADILLTEFEQLSCYGGASLTVTGTYGCGECGGLAMGSFEPGWLADPNQGYFQVVRVQPGKGLGWTDMHISPGSGLEYPAEGSIIRVVGHYDDPAASTCRIASGVEGELTIADQRAAVLYCRERFVIDSYEVIGVDPKYPDGERAATTIGPCMSMGPKSFGRGRGASAGWAAWACAGWSAATIRAADSRSSSTR